MGRPLEPIEIPGRGCRCDPHGRLTSAPRCCASLERFAVDETAPE
jgi:hypothetical protein